MVSALFTPFLEISLIAANGHIDSQSPQPIHFSSSTEETMGSTLTEPLDKGMAAFPAAARA